MSVVQWNRQQEVEAMDRRLWRSMLGVLDGSRTPVADLYETDDEFVVEVEAPGFSKNELRIEVSDHMLSIMGERHREREDDGKAFRLHERLETAFERRFELPTGADTKRISATLGKGLLEIHAPKLAAAQPRRVTIGGE